MFLQPRFSRLAASIRTLKETNLIIGGAIYRPN
jgi:hypothetical protein